MMQETMTIVRALVKRALENEGAREAVERIKAGAEVLAKAMKKEMTMANQMRLMAALAKDVAEIMKGGVNGE